jgi:4-hydroxybenzoate polyprenyltransferase
MPVAARPAAARLTLLRPRFLPALLALVGVGYGWAHWNRALPARGQAELGIVLLAWSLLHVGTMWLNAALDRDEGPVLLGEPALPPEGLRAWGHAALGLAIGVGAFVPAVLPAVLLAAALAEAYSWPGWPWKASPVLGPLVNVVGYGLLTPWVGYRVVGPWWDMRTVCMVIPTCAGVLGAYYLAQSFQGEEDRRRGYRTLAATDGGPAAVWAARLGFGAAFAGVLVLAAIGWLPRALLPLWVGGWWVDRSLARVASRPDAGGPAAAQETGRRVVLAAVLGMLLLAGDYVRGSLAGEPVAGLGTSGGHPPGLVGPSILLRAQR